MSYIDLCYRITIDNELIPTETCDSDEIVIPKTKATITYEYPLKEPITISYTLTNDNSNGFTRREVANIILQQYREFYDKNLFADGKVFYVPHTSKKIIAHRHYDLAEGGPEWLFIHSLYENDNGTYTARLDNND